MRVRLLRLLAGVALLSLLLPLLFALTLPAMHRWGASDAEVAAALPGDDLLADPQIRWTHGVTIDAPPEAVWPWVAQLGDERAGYYSFTFIENQVGSLTGASDYAVVYRNANAIVPEWQRPEPGDSLIKGVLVVEDVEPGAWLLGRAVDPAVMGWSWLWHVAPADGGRTRLLVRFAIQPAGGVGNPALGFVMDVGGLVMEQRMLHGLKLRAEGWREPAWSEGAEVALWLAALLAGLAAAGLFIAASDWRRPLAVAGAAVIALFVLTFVQPPLWSRLALDLALAAGVWWSARRAPAAALLIPDVRPEGRAHIG